MEASDRGKHEFPIFCQDADAIVWLDLTLIIDSMTLKIVRVDLNSLSTINLLTL